MFLGHCKPAPLWSRPAAKPQSAANPSMVQDPPPPPPWQSPFSSSKQAIQPLGVKPFGSLRLRGLFWTYAYPFQDWGLEGSAEARPAGSGDVQRPIVEEYWRNHVWSRLVSPSRSSPVNLWVVPVSPAV